VISNSKLTKFHSDKYGACQKFLINRLLKTRWPIVAFGNAFAKQVKEKKNEKLFGAIYKLFVFRKTDGFV